VADTSFVTADGQRDLQQSVVIDAPEFAKWNAPVSAVDLRVGGSLEATYDVTHKIGDPDNIMHRIIAFQRTVIIMQYEPLTPTRTRVTISVTGWGNDPDSQRLYAFFKGGNGYLLQKMKTVFDVGPIQTADYRALGLMARLKVRVHGMKTSYTPRADKCLACGNREPHQAFRRRSP
jgi:hypothetical protein